jgi:hypothetical protein
MIDKTKKRSVSLRVLMTIAGQALVLTLVFVSARQDRPLPEDVVNRLRVEALMPRGVFEPSPLGTGGRPRTLVDDAMRRATPSPTVSSTVNVAERRLQTLERALNHFFSVENRERLLDGLTIPSPLRTDLANIRKFGFHAIYWASLDYAFTPYPLVRAGPIAGYIDDSKKEAHAAAVWRAWLANQSEVNAMAWGSWRPDSIAYMLAGFLAVEEDVPALRAFVDPASKVLKQRWALNDPRSMDPMIPSIRKEAGEAALLRGFWPAGEKNPAWVPNKVKGRTLLLDADGSVRGDAQRGDALLDLFVIAEIGRQQRWRHKYAESMHLRDALVGQKTLARVMRALMQESGLLFPIKSDRAFCELFEATLSALYAAPHGDLAEAHRQSEAWVVHAYRRYSSALRKPSPHLVSFITTWADHRSRGRPLAWKQASSA